MTYDQAQEAPRSGWLGRRSVLGRVAVLLGPLFLVACFSEEPEGLPPGTACPFDMSSTEGCRAEPTVDELSVPWPENDAAMRSLARVARDAPTLTLAVAAERMTELHQPGIPTFPAEGYGSEAVTTMLLRQDKLLLLHARSIVVMRKLAGIDKTPYSAELRAAIIDRVHASAREAWLDARALPSTNRFGQTEPRTGLYEALYAATTLLLVERALGTRSTFDEARASAEAFVAERTGALAAQERQSAGPLGTVALGELVATWRMLEPR